MGDSFTQVPPDSTGDKIDTEQLSVGANTVERQRIQVAGASAAQIAAVLNGNPTTEYGLFVRTLLDALISTELPIVGMDNALHAYVKSALDALVYNSGPGASDNGLRVRTRLDAYLTNANAGATDYGLIVRPRPAAYNRFSPALGTSNNNSSVKVMDGATGGKKNIVNSIQFINAYSVAVTIRLQDGSGGTVFGAATALAALTMFNLTIPTGIQTTSANDWYMDTLSAVCGGNCYVRVYGYTED